ncbi:hypothetical protein ACHAWC_007610, partial [Mediolabrus comicus]
MSSNQTPIRMTRSRYRASSSTHSVATEPSDASAAPKTPAPAAAKTGKTFDKSTKSTEVVKGKGNGRGRKPSSTAASTSSTSSTSAAEVPDLDDNNDHSSLIFTTEDLVNLSEAEQKAKLVDIFTHLGIKDINEPIPPSKEESLRVRLRLGNAEVNKLLKRFAPGCTRKTSTDILILADYLRRAIFPADNLEGVPACRQNGSVLCDISLRSTYYHITLIPPQSGNGVTQETLKDDIRKQVDSVRNGGNHYFTDLSNDQLKERLKRLGVKSKLPTKRPALVRKLREKERDVSSTTVVGSAAAGGEGGIVGNNNGENEQIKSLYDQQIDASLCQQLAATNIFNITVNNITSTTVNDNSNTSI